MPRRVVPPAVAAPLPPAPLSPLIKRLRQDWRWAGLSQFVWTFSEAFGLVDWDIELLEKELDGSEGFVLVDLITKMLVALTWNRQINRQNVFENLRKQYLKRDPEHNALGTVEEPVEWAALGLDQQIQILWQLCEWQLVEPTRLRSLLKTEEEAPSWRVDPIGWDKHGNTYFLFDDNRLWVQRARPLPPRPPKRTSMKAKRAQKAQRKAQPVAKRSSRKAKVPSPVDVDHSPPVPLLDEDPIVTGPRRRKQAVFYGNVVPTVEALKRSGRNVPPSPSRGSTRRSAGAVATPTKQQPPLPLGTRVSRRLRPVDDEWQQIPKEWLSNGAQAEGDEESELSDLTDEETHDALVSASIGCTETQEPPVASSPPSSPPPADPTSPMDHPSVHASETPEENGDSNDADHLSSDDGDSQPHVDEFEQTLIDSKTVPEGFIEWEAVCVTLYEWQTFPEQWSKSKNPDEKALYTVLSEEVGPQIIEVLQAKETERIKQEAINNRKRSSRIAIRELEKAESARQEEAQREMEERMEKLRQAEEEKAREEAEILERERAREARLREREERIAARQQAILDRAAAEDREREKAERRRERRKRRRDGEEVETSSDEENTSMAPTPMASAGGQGSWELRCEVCKQQGWDLMDTADLVCCDDCARWQHVNCHDRQDLAAGRPIRDWDAVDFRCKECEHRRPSSKRPRLEEPEDGVAAQDPVTAASTVQHPEANISEQLVNGNVHGNTSFGGSQKGSSSTADLLPAARPAILDAAVKHEDAQQKDTQQGYSGSVESSLLSASPRHGCARNPAAHVSSTVQTPLQTHVLQQHSSATPVEAPATQPHPPRLIDGSQDVVMPTEESVALHDSASPGHIRHLDHTAVVTNDEQTKASG